MIRARPAPIPLLALPCRTMSHHIRALTVRAVQDLDHHEATLACWGFSPSHPLLKGSRSTSLKHLPPAMWYSFPNGVDLTALAGVLVLCLPRRRRL